MKEYLPAHSIEDGVESRIANSSIAVAWQISEVVYLCTHSQLLAKIFNHTNKLFGTGYLFLGQTANQKVIQFILGRTGFFRLLTTTNIPKFDQLINFLMHHKHFKIASLVLCWRLADSKITT